MKIVLISANTEQINMPTLPLGLVCVATATEKTGHDVKVVDLISQPDACMVIGKTLEEFRPDVIGISLRNIDDQCMKNTKFLLDQVKVIVADCRSFSDAPIVLGGAGYSIYPEASLAYVGADMGIQGEGEKAFPALIARIQERAGLEGIPGLYLPGRGLQSPRVFTQDLDGIPLPDHHLWRSC
ncbi:MAG TPA: cobalamin B12-binding domain-containing protein, partial [Desulfatiglandales bacterium]|nr:cobalamin B12-binding domain-containing protein [Desulfatiglandales bacterium]